MNPDEPSAQPEPAKHPKSAPTGKGVYLSEELFGNESEIIICHNGETYRLRKTRSGKLLLNK